MICYWTDKKRYLIHYRMVKFCIRHGMVVGKFQETISFKHSKWLQKYTNFSTQKRNQAVNDFEKDFYILLNDAFYGKTMATVRNRCVIESNKKDDTDETVKQQNKLTVIRIHKPYENCNSYTFNQNEVLIDKTNLLGIRSIRIIKIKYV